MLKRIGLFICIIFCLGSEAQNFIPNTSFENYASCPKKRNDGKTANSWDTPSEGTSDYFNSCALVSSELSVPVNFAGSQAPRTGNAYSGFYAAENFHEPWLEYREYMQVTLDSFLVVGGIYTFEMHISLSDSSNFACNNIGAYISADKIASNTDTYLNYKPQVITTSYITDKTGWTKVTGTYIAKGGEHYITIGVFAPASGTIRQAVSGGSKSSRFNGVSYYYLDDVSMTRACDLPSVLLPPDSNICVTTTPSLTINPVANNASSYLWSTGHTTPSLTVNSSGQYILKARTAYCTVYDTINVNFAKKPEVSLGKDTFICKGFVKLNAAASAPSYLWSTGSTDSIIFAGVSGKYWVRAGTSVCYSYDTIQVNVITVTPFSLGPDITMCSGQETTLSVTNNPGMSYRWSTGETSLRMTTGNAGTYWAQAYSGTCSVTDTIKIVIDQVPVISLGNDTALCFQQPFVIEASPSVNYLWSNGSAAASLTVTKPGLYWVESRNNSCTARDSIVITANPVPSVDLGTDKSICKESQELLDAGNPGAAYAWNISGSAQTISVKAPGVYSVTVTNKEGCYATGAIRLDTFASPVVDLGADRSACEGSDALLDAGSFRSYLWQNNSAKRTFHPEASGRYYVSIKDAHSCSASDTVNIFFFNKPEVHLTSYLSLCDPDTIITAQSTAGSYVWNDGSTSPANRITGYGKYTVTVTDHNSCSNTAELEVISSCRGTVYVPNAFTPLNRDGLNQVFIPVMLNVTSMHMYIYNRWGQMIFETTDNVKGWDGTSGDQYAQADVYVYKIDYTGLSGFHNTVTGNVTLLK